ASETGERIARLFVSAIEHDSVLKTAAALAERTTGLRLETIPVTADGMIDLAATGLNDGKGRALIAVQAANNETGVIQPRNRVDGLLLVDAVQKPSPYDASYISLSAHKIGGPQGVGALIVRNDAPFAAQLLGGGQERGLRAGTENVAGVAGFGAAAAAWSAI